MSCTPEISGITSRISPCGSINKSLLTPCRRVGLSRKRKTPSSIVQIISQDSPLHNIETVYTETTPINYGKSVKKNSSKPSLPNNNNTSSTEAELEKSKKSNLNFVENNPAEKKIPKKGLFQTYSEDLFNTSDSFTNSENIELLPEIVNFEDQDSYTSALRDDFVKLGTNMSNSEFLVSNNLSADTILNNKLNKSSTNTISQDDDSDEDFRILKKSKIKRTLSLTKSTSSTDRDVETTSCKNISNSTKECIVHLKKISENELNLYENNTTVQKSSSPVIDIAVDEEEDAFTSMPEQEKTNKSSMIYKIRTLEKSLKPKKNLLADLKQASIYKNKHSIEELNELTSKWTVGCASGLNDLLALLQAHGPIDMTTLLNNLRIPSDMIVKLFPPNVE